MGVVEENLIPTSDAISLESGQIAILMTDGLAESMNPSNELFGTTRIQELVYQHRNDSALEIVDKLLAAVNAHCSPRKHLGCLEFLYQVL